MSKLAIARVRAPWWRRALAWLRRRPIAAVAGSDYDTWRSRQEAHERLARCVEVLTAENQRLQGEVAKLRARTDGLSREHSGAWQQLAGNVYGAVRRTYLPDARPQCRCELCDTSKPPEGKR